MAQYKVSNSQSGLAEAPIVKGDSPEGAAASYVAEQRLDPGLYWVQKVADPKQVSVTTERRVAARDADDPAATPVEEVVESG